MTDDHVLVEFADRREWRRWLESNSHKVDEVWMLIYKKGSRGSSLSLDEAVEEALCFGWIDGKLKSIDDEKYSLRFSPRRANSVWSVRNIRRVERLIAEGLMTESGRESIEEGRRSGQWQAAIDSEQIDAIPADLEKALRRKKGALAAYRGQTDSTKKRLLHWLYTAKKEETRQRRAQTIVEMVTQ